MRPWPDLSRRCADAELIDDLGALSAADVRRMHVELSHINRWLGGVNVSLAALLARVGSLDRITVLDVGAGGCDGSRALVRWARTRGVPVRIYALDLSRRACEEVKARSSTCPEIVPIVADGRRLPFPDRSVDAAHAALLFHHLSTSDGVRMLREMRRVSRRGVVVNDLHRHPFAWAAIRALTRLFSRSRLIRHDAPLSVRRGFRRGELAALAREAGVESEIRWRWAFRWVLTADA